MHQYGSNSNCARVKELWAASRHRHGVHSSPLASLWHECRGFRGRKRTLPWTCNDPTTNGRMVILSELQKNTTFLTQNGCYVRKLAKFLVFIYTFYNCVTVYRVKTASECDGIGLIVGVAAPTLVCFKHHLEMLFITKPWDRKQFLYIRM